MIIEVSPFVLYSIYSIVNHNITTRTTLVRFIRDYISIKYDTNTRPPIEYKASL